MSKAFLIFSGYNQRAVVAFCREATRLQVSFAIVACAPEDTILLTSYREKVIAIRREKSLMIEDIDDCLEKARMSTGTEQWIVLPSSEFLNRFFLQHRSRYEAMQVHIPLVAASLYAQISDKYTFGELCSRYKLRVPAEFEWSESVRYPFVAKPKAYFSGQRTPSPYLILTHKDWADFQQNENPADFYLQEFVEGQSVYLLYFLSSKGQSVVFSQENLVQQAKGKSIILAKSASFHEEKIAADYQEMLLQEGFEGLIMIELKKMGSEYCMIEANPRLWGPSQLFVDAGVPIFEEFIRSQGFNIPRNDSKFGESVYFWRGGISEDERHGHSIAFHCFTPEMLENEFESLLNKEVYFRPDTKDIYFREQNTSC
jgi:hypothetical protein